MKKIALPVLIFSLLTLISCSQKTSVSEVKKKNTYNDNYVCIQNDLDCAIVKEIIYESKTEKYKKNVNQKNEKVIDNSDKDERFTVDVQEVRIESHDCFYIYPDFTKSIKIVYQDENGHQYCIKRNGSYFIKYTKQETCCIQDKDFIPKGAGDFVRKFFNK